MTAEIINLKKEEPNGFVAGTLVHTDKGLIPIEQLKFGDVVLSKSENNPNGALSYQRITKIHRFEDKTIYMVRFVEFPSDDSVVHSGIICTPNHPFWMADVGWIRADTLCVGDEITLSNGNKVLVHEWSSVLSTAEKGVGWAAEGLEGIGEINAWTGYLIDLKDGQLNTDFNKEALETVYAAEYTENDEYMWKHDDRLMLTAVYNINVENIHTYFVGELGVWVHD